MRMPTIAMTSEAAQPYTDQNAANSTENQYTFAGDQPIGMLHQKRNQRAGSGRSSEADGEGDSHANDCNREAEEHEGNAPGASEYRHFD